MREPSSSSALPVAARVSLAHQAVRLIALEAVISFKFIMYDRFTGWIPPVLFTSSACATIGLSVEQSVVRITLATLYFWLYIYTFTLSNQLAGIREDTLNKPDRPLVTGLCTPRGAAIRLIVMLVAFVVCGALMGVLPWAVLWSVGLLLHNQGRWSWHWLGKDFLMGVATLAQLSAAWGIAGPISEVGWRWIATLSLVIFLLVPLQDLRDMTGDAANGRTTMVLRVGERRTRNGLAAGFVLLPVGTHYALYAPAHLRGPGSVAVEAGLAVLSLAIAIRVLRSGTPRRDHNTYSMLTYWYTATLAGAFIVLGNPTW